MWPYTGAPWWTYPTMPQTENKKDFIPELYSVVQATYGRRMSHSHMTEEDIRDSKRLL